MARSTEYVCVFYVFLSIGNGLEVIMKFLKIDNILHARTDRRYVSMDSLAVDQIKDELRSRNLSTKGNKVTLLVRLKEAVGNPQAQVKCNAPPLVFSTKFHPGIVRVLGLCSWHN